MKIRFLTIFFIVLIFCSCSSKQSDVRHGIPIISWGGIPADNADTLYSLAEECSFDMHLGLYRAKESAVASMDAAARKGIDVIISFPQIKDSTELAVNLIKYHPALFAGCNVLGVWHIGENIPSGTKILEVMPHKNVRSLQISGYGGIVALIENEKDTYLIIQNRDCINPAVLDISFTRKTVRHTLNGELPHDSQPITLSPGNLAIFTL